VSYDENDVRAVVGIDLVSPIGQLPVCGMVVGTVDGWKVRTLKLDWELRPPRQWQAPLAWPTVELVSKPFVPSRALMRFLLPERVFHEEALEVWEGEGGAP
jgi:hypothetical protein